MKERAGFHKAIEMLCLVGVTLLILWFCYDLIFADGVPFFRDLSTYFYPLRFVLSESLGSGTLPLWNRHMANGFPVLANFQSGVFYPPHLLFLFLPFFLAVRALFVLHFMVAAVGSYSLLRYWSHSRNLSLLGALLFTLGGTLISLSNLLNHFQTAVWLPWGVLAAEHVIRSSTWKNYLIFVLLLALQFLAGSPELFILSLLLIIASGLRTPNPEVQMSFGCKLTILCSAFLVSMVLSMVQILPTVELLLESRRNEPLPLAESLRWSLEPVTLANLFLLDKEVDLTTPAGIRLFLANEPTFFVTYYLGAISLFGICFWLSLGSWRSKITPLCLLTISLIVAMGEHTPVYQLLLDQWPGLGVLRFPEKVFYVSYVLLTYMTVGGLAKFVDEPDMPCKPGLYAAGVMTAVWVATYVHLRRDSTAISTAVEYRTGLSRTALDNLTAVAGILSSLERQVILIVSFFFLFVVFKYGKIRYVVFSCLIVMLTFMDLVSAHRGYLFAIKPDFVFNGSRILAEPEPETSRLFYYPAKHNLHPSFFVVRGRPNFEEATAMFFYNLLPNEGIVYKIDYFQELDALARRPYTEFLGVANHMDPVTQVKLLKTFNVAKVVSLSPLNIKGMSLIAEAPRQYSWLYQVENPMPRVYIVGDAVVEANSRAALLRIASEEFDPNHTAVVNRPAGVRLGGAVRSTAKIVSYKHQSVTIHAALDGPGLLVLADSYYPGWKAYVNGRETEIYRANHFFRAIALEQGEYEVEFKYQPKSFEIGRLVSLITVAAVTLISVWVVYMKKRKRSREKLQLGDEP